MISYKHFNFGLKSIILLFILFLSICAVSAHQPRLEVGVNSSMSNPIVVQNPEISQAFYGSLNGQPDYYKITSNKTFELLVNILVPQSPGISSDFVSANITDSSGKTIAMLAETNLVGHRCLKNLVVTITSKAKRSIETSVQELIM